MKFSIFGFYVYSFYIGSVLVENEFYNSKTNKAYNQKDVLSVLIALITGFVGLIAALPNVQSLVAAKTLGALIFKVIEREQEASREVPGASPILNLIINRWDGKRWAPERILRFPH